MEIARVSVAFTKEDSAETAAETQLPDRPISGHPNLVTAGGLKALESQLNEARVAYEAAALIEDVNERRRQSAGPVRDLRYYAERLRTAQLMPDPATIEIVAFGSTVTFTRDDGRRQTYRIVGEDEADPKAGSISYVSPIAAAFMGKSVGDSVTLGEQDLEITAIA
jgi:transcription elongation GreA/GreB family factor